MTAAAAAPAPLRSPGATTAGFGFALRTEVTFGAGTLARVGEPLDALGARHALLVTDPGLVAAGAVDAVLRHLEGRLEVTVYDAVPANPTASAIDAGERLRSQRGCDAVVGFGGGSSLDAAKGIAIVATSGGEIADYAGAGRVTVPPLPVVAVPTTAGTGAEVSNAIAVVDDRRHTKFAVRSPLVAPLHAVCDPALLRTLPESVAAATAVDALCHCVEAYVSRGGSPLTDLLALEGIRRCGASLGPFVAYRGDPRAAGDMLYAALLGGIVISLARTGAAHTLTRPLGDRVVHGVANAIVLPHVLEFNAPAAPAKLAEVARALGRPVAGSDLAAAREAVVAVRELVAALGLPARLRDVGVVEDELPALARTAHELDLSALNPRELTPARIEDLLRKAY